MSRNTSNRRSPLTRLITSLLLLAVIYIVLYLITPSTASYYEIPSDKVIASLEVPALEEGDTLTLHTGYSLVYDEEHENAKWVAYRLDRDELYGLYEREDDFRPDDSIATGSAELSDYRGSGYDRGHLIPAADATWSEEAMSDTFFLSNMTPQEPQFNRGIWADLEATVRNFADRLDGVYVVTGPLYLSPEVKTIGENEVAVPDSFFKAILSVSGGKTEGIGFILANEKSGEALSRFILPIDTIEEEGGFDLFPLLDDEMERTAEAAVHLEYWPFDEFRITRDERIAYLDHAAEQDETGNQEEEHLPSHTFLTVMMSSKKVIDPLISDLKQQISQIFTQYLHN